MDDRHQYSRFAAFSAATIYEAAGKLGDLAPCIRPVALGMRIVGKAFTVRCRQGDASAFTRALDEAQAGHVLVIDSGANAAATCWGGTASIAAARRNIAGVVTNGLVRDVREIIASTFPVFCAGFSVRGGMRHGGGESQVPISVGDAVVMPGDLIVADEDGVVVVSFAKLDTVFAATLERKCRENEITARVAAGESYATAVLGSKG